MTALVLNGKSLAATMEADLARRAERLVQSAQPRPVLATILVGDDPASATYVRMKGAACARSGMVSRPILLAAQTRTEELLAQIDALNADAAVKGILLQHPVPAQIDERAAFDRIAPAKDVDGVTSAGFGALAMGMAAYGSATPAGIMLLLAHYGIALSGRRAVVVGRSAILGKPMAMMLLNADCTVTLCHSKTQNLAEEIHRADLVIGALGKRRFIQADWIKDGAVVVDAGYHPGGVGDIDLSDSLKARVAAYTPVPGGVGPMTIAALMLQTMQAAERAVALCR